MSNDKYEDKYYNESIKNEFLSQYQTGTQKVLDRLFKISFSSEDQIKTDLYNFNRDQIRKLLFRTSPKTAYSSQANGSFIRRYIDWSLSKGLRKTLNPLDGVDKEWYKQFVQDAKLFWTDEEIEIILNSCANFQDAAIISLIFNGCLGTANSEITNLKREHINEETNQLILNDDNGNQRTISVDDRCIRLCLGALREFSYEKMNGNPSEDIKSPITNLVQNNYVIKSSITRTEHYDQADMNIIHRRLTVIAKSMGEKNFTPQNILNSGMLSAAKELYLANGRLGEDEYKIIFEKFNANNSARLKEIINVEKIKELYNLK